MKTPKWLCLDNAGTIATITAVGLLVIAANLDSSSGWLLGPAWGALWIRALWWFVEHERDEKIMPVVLMAIPLVIVATASQRFQPCVMKVIKSPTLGNWGTLISSSPFLFLLACYFGLSLFFAKIKLDKVKNNYDALEKRRLEEIASYQNELKSLKEQLSAKSNKSNNN